MHESLRSFLSLPLAEIFGDDTTALRRLRAWDASHVFQAGEYSPDILAEIIGQDRTQRFVDRCAAHHVTLPFRVEDEAMRRAFLGRPPNVAEAGMAGTLLQSTDVLVENLRRCSIHHASWAVRLIARYRSRAQPLKGTSEHLIWDLVENDRDALMHCLRLEVGDAGPIDEADKNETYLALVTIVERMGLWMGFRATDAESAALTSLLQQR